MNMQAIVMPTSIFSNPEKGTVNVTMTDMQTGGSISIKGELAKPWGIELEKAYKMIGRFMSRRDDKGGNWLQALDAKFEPIEMAIPKL